jgi:hypothetical protein
MERSRRLKSLKKRKRAMPLYESRTYTLWVGMSNGDEMYDEIASRFTRATTGRPVRRNVDG